VATLISAHVADTFFKVVAVRKARVRGAFAGTLPLFFAAETFALGLTNVARVLQGHVHHGLSAESIWIFVTVDTEAGHVY